MMTDTKKPKNKEESNGSGGKNSLPYGLCKEYSIPYPKGSDPEDVWNILEARDVVDSVEEAYQDYYDRLNEQARAPKKIEYRQNTPYEKILADDRAREAESAAAPKPAPTFSPMKSGKDFRGKLLAAKEQIDEDARWRVSSDYSESDYEADGVKLYASGDSVYALKPHGKGYDIVSVCAVRGKGAKGREILADAVAKGGDRLDAFGKKLYLFYTRNGFAPVSWTPFNAEYAPEDWKSAKAHGFDVQEEPVIFYKYTGKSTPYTERTYEDFLQTVKPDEGADGYDNAMRKRDKELDG